MTLNGKDKRVIAVLSRPDVLPVIERSISPHKETILRRFYGIGCERATVKQIADDHDLSSGAIRSTVKNALLSVLLALVLKDQEAA